MKRAKPSEASLELSLPKVRVGIIASRFNAEVVEGLIEGALGILQDHGVEPPNIGVFRVPGAFELPLAAQHLSRHSGYTALIALGAIIQGETPHFEYVASACTQGLTQVMLHQNMPIGFGVLTVNNLQQAIERARQDACNKGGEAAQAALEMIQLLNASDSEQQSRNE